MKKLKQVARMHSVDISVFRAPSSGDINHAYVFILLRFQCLFARSVPWIERRWWYRFVSLKCLFLLFDIKWDFLGSANRNEWDSSKEADDIAILPTFLIDLVIILYQLFWFACEQFLLIIHAKFRVRSVISDLLIKCHAPRAR